MSSPVLSVCEEGKGSGRGLSQTEVEVVIGEAEQQLLNDRGETSSQQASRVLRELQSEVAEEVNGEGAHDAPREDLTIAQLRRAQFGNPEPRNGTGREFGFKCFGPGCGKRFPPGIYSAIASTSNVCFVSHSRIKWLRIGSRFASVWEV